MDGSGWRPLYDLPPRDGFLFLDRDKFHASFAADVPAGLAAFMADSQVPWGVDALGGPVTDPAWRTKPSWYMVTTEDRMIPRRPSAPCPSGLGRPWPRWRPATPFTYRNRPPLRTSSNRPCPRSPRRSNCGTCLYGTDNDQTPRARLRRSLSQPRSGSQARPIPRDRDGLAYGDRERAPSCSAM